MVILKLVRLRSIASFKSSSKHEFNLYRFLKIMLRIDSLFLPVASYPRVTEV
ncbi:MAG: hypothetical protein QNJ38_13560 [Prochloraceae cyanobacterium]|nr:hypothetical protein [Prochloraceae cyanobacterium]